MEKVYPVTETLYWKRSSVTLPSIFHIFPHNIPITTTLLISNRDTYIENVAELEILLHPVALFSPNIIYLVQFFETALTLR